MNRATTFVCTGGVALVLCMASGCSANRGPHASASEEALQRIGLEVAATTEDQARQDVLQAPTTFEVSFEDDTYCWERARFFLENYSTESPGLSSSAVTKIVGKRWSLASNPAQSKYQYEVSKDSGRDGYTYSVSCIAGEGGDIAQASMNAGNFARFIREGKLEMSLLRPRS